jgi:hypothetical protein
MYHETYRLLNVYFLLNFTVKKSSLKAVSRIEVRSVLKESLLNEKRIRSKMEEVSIRSVKRRETTASNNQHRLEISKRGPPSHTCTCQQE